MDAAELGFEPAVSATGAPTARTSGATARATRSPRRRRRARSGGGLRRRLGAAAVLIAALCAMGGSYAMFAASSGAAGTGSSTADIEAGRQLYQVGCITCHGANLDGVKGNGPSIIGSGSASVYFQVSTGRMPLARQGAYAPRKEAKYNETQTEQLGAYIQSVGGGPTVPVGKLESSSAQIGKGGELFRLNCASCHGATFHGAPLSGGKIAPSLLDANDKQIYTAMLSGPENMPVFSDNTITPAQKKQIIGYIQTLKASQDPGGNGIARIGPVSEAIVIWVGGVGALMISILWIGARAR
ncbi:c-type cytochrome [uncultured Jatrophihabitans sp.]|uniref:cytochrome bc1 complex diheme cytochrome c subunit n=1 Tax=uncultured Jatrophihabitans sp. TaxID=1610747 RepID=UPI0035CA9346